MKNTLKTDKINSLFNKGIWVNSEYITAIYSNSDSFEYMVSAPIKKFRKATDRNRIKRILRASIDKLKVKNISIAFIYKSTKIEDYNVIDKNIKEIWNKVKV